MNNNKVNISLIIVIFLITILTSCNTAENIETTPSPVEVPEVLTSAMIKNSTFTSDSLGVEIKLPGEWYIAYETTPDYMGGVSLISGFDSTIPTNGSTPKLIFEKDNIGFMINKHEDGGEDLTFIASKDEYDGISIDQVIINIKDGFVDKSEKTFEDLPDLNLDGLIIKRFEVTVDGFAPTMHVFLNNGYTILINCRYGDEAAYNEMVDIISSIKRN